jgi:hypothetical protein
LPYRSNKSGVFIAGGGVGFRSFPSPPPFLTGGKRMATKKIQIFWLILATLFVGCIIWIVTDSLVVTAISGTFTGVLGLFLGLDIMTMIHKTKGLPPGIYKAMNTHRYVISLCVFAVLLAEAFVISALFKREMNTLYLSFGIGFVVTIGGLISGVETNKIFTGAEPEA